MVDTEAPEAARISLGNRIPHVVAVRINQAEVRSDCLTKERRLPGDRGVEMLGAFGYVERVPHVVTRQVACARELWTPFAERHGGRGAGDRRAELLQLGGEVLLG